MKAFKKHFITPNKFLLIPFGIRDKVNKKRIKRLLPFFNIGSTVITLFALIFTILYSKKNLDVANKQADTNDSLARITNKQLKLNYEQFNYAKLKQRQNDTTEAFNKNHIIRDDNLRYNELLAYQTLASSTIKQSKAIIEGYQRQLILSEPRVGIVNVEKEEGKTTDSVELILTLHNNGYRDCKLFEVFLAVHNKKENYDKSFLDTSKFTLFSSNYIRERNFVLPRHILESKETFYYFKSRYYDQITKRDGMYYEYFKNPTVVSGTFQVDILSVKELQIFRERVKKRYPSQYEE